MIRKRRLSIPKLGAWLETQIVNGRTVRYQLRLWKANHRNFDNIEDELKLYIREAHEDVCLKIRRALEDDLAPFTNEDDDPTANYPSALNRISLQGYFGETIGGALVEHLGSHGKQGWCVPAYLFRFHTVELQHLEDINQRLLEGISFNPDAPSERRPGRTGDDAFAFIKNDDGEITDVLVLEAKCLSSHNSTTLGNAHTQVSGTPKRPIDIPRLTELLGDYNTDTAKEWRLALLNYYRKGYRMSNRFDGVIYICTNAPVKRSSWMPKDNPHPKYIAGRPLEGLEIHMPDLDEVMNRLYRNT